MTRIRDMRGRFVAAATLLLVLWLLLTALGANRADSHDGRPRVLCWILTSPKTLMTRAKFAGATWGRRCDKLLYMSSEEDDRLEGVVALDVVEDRSELWRKTTLALKHIYKNHLHEAEWFLKADDDTYVVVENLRALLAGRDPDMPDYLGCQVRQGGHGKPYMSGGAGYVLSRRATEMFALAAPDGCGADVREAANVEDKLVGRCLDHLGVANGESRDAAGMERFHVDSAETHLKDRAPKLAWFRRNSPFRSAGCCSPSAVSFHYVRGNKMREMEYLIYGLGAGLKERRRRQP